MTILENLCITLCALLILRCSPNERIFYKNGIACSASIRSSEQWDFYGVEIGTPNNPYDGRPALDIKIPGIGKF